LIFGFFWVLILDPQKKQTEMSKSLATIFAREVRRPRRSFLYVPGHDTRKVARALAAAPDVVCLDLEDGVSLRDKPAARANIAATLARLRADPSTRAAKSEIAVRVNSRYAEGGALLEQDLDALFGAGGSTCRGGSSGSSPPPFPDALVLPKCDDVADMPDLVTAVDRRAEAHGLGQHVSDPLLQAGGATAAAGHGSTALVGMVESARSLLDIRAIFGAAPLPLSAVIFGGDDYAADLGLRRTGRLDAELAHARQTVKVASAAHGIQCIDAVHLAFRDRDAFAASSAYSREQGFDGRQCIHPDQVDPADEAYGASDAEIAWAAAVVDAWGDGATGAFALHFDGKDHMIDMPTVRNAVRVLIRAGDTSRPLPTL
jgi:citrate lyase subunit beta/citryl-CoA lyase